LGCLFYIVKGCHCLILAIFRNVTKFLG
jgi:hypothetical protein